MGLRRPVAVALRAVTRFELASEDVVEAAVVVVPLPTLPAAAAAEAVEPSAPARRRCQVEPRVFPAHNQHRKMHA